jgi:hypothetical protein
MGSVGGKLENRGAAEEICCDDHISQERGFEWCCPADKLDHRGDELTELGKSIGNELSSARTHQSRRKKVTIANDPNVSIDSIKESVVDYQRLGIQKSPPPQGSQSQHLRFNYMDRPNWASADQEQLVKTIIAVARFKEIKPPGLKAMQRLRAAKILGQKTNIDDYRFTFYPLSNI